MMMSCKQEAIYKDLSACDRFDIRNSVDSIRMPTLILCGEDDVLTPVRYSRFWGKKEKIAGSELALVKDAGHMAMLEKPDECEQGNRNIPGERAILKAHRRRPSRDRSLKFSTAAR